MEHPNNMPSYLVLARKYRPTTFSEVVGQDHVIKTLSNAILSDRVAHAFLFCGVRGVGKTTVARIMAKALNCSGRAPGSADPCNQCSACKEIAAGISMDVQEIDGASNTSVENIREINENIKYPPVSSPYKIIIIDEVHMISINAFNALLKTLEEPPAHAKFIFATTESHKVPATINSRCQRFNFRVISVRDIVDGMASILEKEGIKADEDALALVAREAQGSFRDALSLLDQVIALSSEHIKAHDVTEILGISGRECFGRLLAAVLDRDAGESLQIAHELFEHGYDPEQFVLDLIHYMRNLVVASTVPAQARKEGLIDATPAEVEELDQLAQRASAAELQNLLSMLMRAEGEVRRSTNPWIALDMTVLRMAYAPDLVDLAALVRRIDAQPVEVAPARATAKRSIPAPRAKSAEPPAPARTGSTQRAAKEQAAVEKTVSESQADDIPAEGFTITKVTPLPSGAPDEVWSALKEKISHLPGGAPLRSVLDHGKLISFGPTEVEIGFTKPAHRQQFEERLATKPAMREIFLDFFGQARIKVLTLVVETSLVTQKPYSAPANGQTDLERALRHEATDHPITRTVLEVFEDSSIEDIKILAPKP